MEERGARDADTPTQRGRRDTDALRFRGPGRAGTGREGRTLRAVYRFNKEHWSGVPGPTKIQSRGSMPGPTNNQSRGSMVDVSRP